MHFRPARRPLILYAFTLLALAGCSKEPEITSYDVPRDGKAPVATPPTADSAGGESRMIATIFIRGNQAWFLKTMAPKDAVDKVADQLHQFAESIELPEDHPAAIEWKVPEGWTEGPPRMMRDATLIVPNENVEVAISKLAFPGDLAEYLKMNINRWRGQLGLDPADEMDEAAGVEEIEVDGQKAWVFDATGTAAGGGMMPPMMGGNAPFAGGATMPPAAQPPKEEPEADKPATNEDAESRMIAAIFIRGDTAWFLKTMAAEEDVDNAADALKDFAKSVTLPDDQPGVIEWKVPEGWTEGPPRMMRDATLLLPGGEVEVAISKLAFPGDLDGYLQMNINRWRGQLGLEPADTMNEAAGVEEFEINGQKAWLFDATGTATGGGMMAPMMRGNAPFAGRNSATTPSTPDSNSENE